MNDLFKPTVKIAENLKNNQIDALTRQNEQMKNALKKIQAEAGEYPPFSLSVRIAMLAANGLSGVE